MCIATLTLNSIKFCSRLALCYQHDWQGVHLVNSNALSCTNLMCSVNYASTRHQRSVTWVPWVDLAAIIKQLAACLTLVALLGSASSEGLFDLTGWPPRLTSIASRMSSLQEKTTPFGINLMRSQVLYRAAQGLKDVEVVLARPVVPPVSSSLQCISAVVL